MTSVVMVLRHGEKQLGDAPPHGVTIDGVPDEESLTPRGWQRAGALVGLFVPEPAVDRSPRLPTPTHLFAALAGPGIGSRRPYETLVPLGERLGLAVNSPFRKEELDKLARAARAIDGIVLISWEHHLIPSLANLLADAPSDVPQTWPDDRYDVVWIFESAAAGKRTFRQVPEMLLGGDRPEPIAAAVSDRPVSTDRPTARGRG